MGVFVLWSYDLVAGGDSIIRNLGINTEDLSTKRVAETVYFCIG